MVAVVTFSGSTGFLSLSVKLTVKLSIIVPFELSGKTVAISIGAPATIVFAAFFVASSEDWVVDSVELFVDSLVFSLLEAVVNSFVLSEVFASVVLDEFVVLDESVVLTLACSNGTMVSFPLLVKTTLVSLSFANAKFNEIEVWTFGEMVKAIFVPVTSYVPISLPVLSFNGTLSSLTKLFSGLIVTEKVLLSVSSFVTSAESLISLLLSTALAEVIVKPLFSCVTAPTCAIGVK